MPFRVFHDQPCLEYALRLPLEGTRAEYGVLGANRTLDRSVLRDRRKASRSTTQSGSASGTKSLAEYVSSIAEDLRQPVVFSTQQTTATATRQNEEATSMVTALSILMKVEATLDKTLSEFKKTDEYDAASAERV
jgi:hypothetical protein